MTSSEKGRRGETAAAEFLEEAGFTILARNHRTRRGEIDLVARDGDVLVFVEVKHWNRCSREDLGFSIDGRKIRRLLHAAKGYLSDHPEFDETRMRFDLVYVPGTGKDILHVKDIIEEES